MSKSSQGKLREVGLSHAISGSETIPFRIGVSLQRCRKYVKPDAPSGAGNVCASALLAGVLISEFWQKASYAEGRGRNLAGRCRLSAVPRFAPGVRARSGDLRKRADRKRAAPTRRWSHRSSNGSGSSYRQLETRFQMIRAEALSTEPSHDGMASQAAPYARTSAGACSAWVPAAQRMPSPSAQRPGRASPPAEFVRSSEKLPTFADRIAENHVPVLSKPFLGELRTGN